MNCAKMAGDRPKQPAYEIFSIECRFCSSNPNPLLSRWVAQAGIKRGTLLKSGYLSVVGLPSMKIVADMHRHATYDNKH